MIGPPAEPIGGEMRPEGMLRRILLVAAFVSLMTVAAPVTQVFACSCMQMTPEIALTNADAAWVGVVTTIGNGGADPNEPVQYTFAVEQMLKGELAITADVRSSRSSAGCGQEFALAQRWRIYGYLDENRQLQTGLCSGNELLAEGVPVPAATPAPPPIQLFVAIGGVILLAGISAWAFTRRNRAPSA